MHTSASSNVVSNNVNDWHLRIMSANLWEYFHCEPWGVKYGHTHPVLHFTLFIATKIWFNLGAGLALGMGCRVLVTFRSKLVHWQWRQSFDLRTETAVQHSMWQCSSCKPPLISVRCYPPKEKSLSHFKSESTHNSRNCPSQTNTSIIQALS